MQLQLWYFNYGGIGKKKIIDNLKSPKRFCLFILI